MSEETKMSLVKSDCLGRRQYGAEYRREAVAAFARSGQSAKGFAGQLGVKYSTFASWVAKARRSGEGQDAGEAPAAPKFLLAEVGEEPAAGGSGGVSVSLPGGAVARAGSREEVLLLAELIKALS
jgi:transposase-like protein